MSLALPIRELLAASGVPLLSAFLLGLLVALSPCPLSTNLGALAYIGRQAAGPLGVLVSGVLYTAGRTASHTVLAALLALAGLEASRLSWLLQDAGQYLLGPGLILAGLVVLPVRLPGWLGARVGPGERLAEAGPTGAFGLGALFALAFCPYSAALFFGGLMPLALGPSGGIAVATAFAVGTGLPVLVVAVLLSIGFSHVARWLNATRQVELLMRRGAGLLFIAAGLYAMWGWLSILSTEQLIAWLGGTPK